MPRVSLGVPVYNGESFLEAALTSLLAQTYDDFELVICDNASTDRTEEIARACAAGDTRVRYHRNRENLGAARNFNRVFQLSRGDFFKWAAYDDVCAPTYLARCMQMLEADPEVVLCHCQTGKIDPDGNTLGSDEIPLRLDAEQPRDRFRDLIVVRHDCFDVFGVARREVLARTPLIGSYIGSDRVLLAELGLRGKLHRVPETLFFRRFHPETSMHLDERQDRVAWFDTSLAGRLSFPNWRILGEILAALNRVPLPFGEKVACLSAVREHVGQRRSFLVRDLKAATKRVLSRSAVGRSILRAVSDEYDPSAATGENQR